MTSIGTLHQRVSHGSRASPGHQGSPWVPGSRPAQRCRALDTMPEAEPTEGARRADCNNKRDRSHRAVSARGRDCSRTPARSGQPSPGSPLRLGPGSTIQASGSDQPGPVPGQLCCPVPGYVCGPALNQPKTQSIKHLVFGTPSRIGAGTSMNSTGSGQIRPGQVRRGGARDRGGQYNRRQVTIWTTRVSHVTSDPALTVPTASRAAGAANDGLVNDLGRVPI